MPRILIVEDDEPTAHAVKDMVERAGHDAVIAATGSQGVRAVDAHRPDLAIVDLDVVGSGKGLGALRMLRVADPDLPAVVLTGGPSETTAIEACNMMCAGYIVKCEPNCEKKLLDAISRGLRTRLGLSIVRDVIDAEAEAAIRSAVSSLSAMAAR